MELSMYRVVAVVLVSTSSVSAGALDYPSSFCTAVTGDPSSAANGDSSITRTKLDSPQSTLMRPTCAQTTTLTYCLDDPEYPSEDIRKEIKANYGIFYKMYAEVTNQTTASMVDGVASGEESKYDYNFYYGDKGSSGGYNSSPKPTYRSDYYRDGGYICPAFIDYNGVMRATNARGEWQFVVNMKPWLQTIRLEQCFYPLSTCSFVSKTLSTQCVQKYSFQRLIAYEPQGRGLYMDVFRLPTACSCHIRPSPGFSLFPGAGQRPGSMDRPERGSSQLFGEATQNIPVHTRVGVSQTAASQLIPQPSNRNPVMVPPSQSSLFDSYLPPGAHTAYQPPPPDFNMPQSVPYDSVLVEKRRLRPEGLSLGDITNDPEVDMSGFGYREDGPPRRGPPGRPIGPPNGPPGPDMGASTAMQLQGDASRTNQVFYEAGPNMRPPSGAPWDNWNSRGSPAPMGASVLRTNLPSGGPNRTGPNDGAFSGFGPQLQLGPVLGPYGPPAPTFRPLKSTLSFYDYNTAQRLRPSTASQKQGS